MNPGTLDPFTIAQMDRATGIEPASPALKAGALPLSYARILRIGETRCACTRHSGIYVLYLFSCSPIRCSHSWSEKWCHCVLRRPLRVHMNMKLWGFRLSGAFLLSAPAGWNNSKLNNLLPVFPDRQIEFACRSFPAVIIHFLHGYSCWRQAADSNCERMAQGASRQQRSI